MRHHIHLTPDLRRGIPALSTWNISHIDNGINSSNGRTNVLPTDAAKLCGILEIGDVVTYPNAAGPAMTMGAGYGTGT